MRPVSVMLQEPCCFWQIQPNSVSSKNTLHGIAVISFSGSLFNDFPRQFKTADLLVFQSLAIVM